MLSKSGISAKYINGKVDVGFNGKHISSTIEAKNNPYGFYINDTKLMIDGLEIAKSSTSKVYVLQDDLYFGDVKLTNNGTCINITADDYSTLLGGGNVDGYTRFNPTAIYNIVSDVSNASIITYSISNGVITFSDSSASSEKDSAIHNNDGLLSENTLNTTTTMTSSKCPCVVVKYFDPIVVSGGKITLEYYVDTYTMDRANSDVVNDTFTVIVETESGSTSKRTTYAGQFSIDTPVFSSNGRTWFSVKCIDNDGVGSVVTFYDVYVKSNTTKNYYTMQSSDLETYGIVPEDRKIEVALANKSALSSFLAAVKDGGYNGVVMLNHTYWVDYHGSNIVFPNEFTIDLNGSTIAVTQCNDLSSGSILKFNNNTDTHIINGYARGNYDGFDFATTHTNTGGTFVAEGLRVTQSKSSHFCSFENLDISNSVGYEAVTDNGDYGSFYQLADPTQDNISKRIDISNGSVVEDNGMIVTTFIPLNGAVTMSVGRSGQCSYAIGTRREYFASFYNSSKEYISSVKTKFYQQARVPTGAAYVRISGYGASSSYWPSVGAAGVLGVCRGQNHSSCITYKNCTFHDTRTVALAFTYGYQLSVIGCYFYNIALETGTYQVTKVFGDLEDGWQWLQSFCMRDCVCDKRRGMSSFVMHYCCNIDFSGNKGVDLTVSGVENGFITDNTISTYSLTRNFRSVMPHVIRERNTITTLSVSYDNGRGNLYTSETVSPVVAMRDSTIKNYCTYSNLYLRRTKNGSIYNE